MIRANRAIVQRSTCAVRARTEADRDNRFAPSRLDVGEHSLGAFVVGLLLIVRSVDCNLTDRTIR